MSRKLLSIPGFGYVTGPIQGAYRVKVKTEDGWRTVGTRKAKQAAEELLQQLWLTHKQGAITPSSKSATISEAALGYLADRETLHTLDGLTRGMLDIDRGAVRRITARWPHQRLRALGPDDVRAWWVSMQTEARSGTDPRPLTARTAEHYVKTLSRVYQWARFEKGWAAYDPCPPGLTAGAQEAKPGQELSPHQCAAIIEHTQPQHQPFTRFLTVTGARISEAAAMTVGAVDLEAGQCWIPTAKRRDRGKLTRRVRPIAISDPVMVAELALLTEGRDSTEPLFTGTRGGRVDPATYRARYWRPAVEAAGVGEAVPHWMRHTVATRLARGGLTSLELKEWMGWASIEMAELYVKAASTGHRRGADILASVSG